MNVRSRFGASAVVTAFVLSMVALVLGAAPAVSQDSPTISITEIDTNAGTIEITNYGDAEVDPNGIILCNFPAYAPIEGASPIAPGESITIDSAAHGVDLDAGGGEMGLYLTAAYTDPTQIISYVQWGSTDRERAPVAVEAGIWTGGFVSLFDGVVEATSDNPQAADDWALILNDGEGEGDGATDETTDTGDDASEGAEEAETTELATTGAESGLLAVVGVALVAAGAATFGTTRRLGRRG